MTSYQPQYVEQVAFNAETADNYLKEHKFVKTVENDSIYVINKYVRVFCSVTSNPLEEPFEVPICNHYLLLQPSSGKPAWMSPTLPETFGFVLVSPEEMVAVLHDSKTEEQ